VGEQVSLIDAILTVCVSALEVVEPPLLLLCFCLCPLSPVEEGQLVVEKQMKDDGQWEEEGQKNLLPLMEQGQDVDEEQVEVLPLLWIQEVGHPSSWNQLKVSLLEQLVVALPLPWIQLVVGYPSSWNQKMTFSCVKSEAVLLHLPLVEVEHPSSWNLKMTSFYDVLEEVLLHLPLVEVEHPSSWNQKMTSFCDVLGVELLHLPLVEVEHPSSWNQKMTFSCDVLGVGLLHLPLEELVVEVHHLQEVVEQPPLV